MQPNALCDVRHLEFGIQSENIYMIKCILSDVECYGDSVISFFFPLKGNKNIEKSKRLPRKQNGSCEQLLLLLTYGL